ncbi:MAG TPA: hypothetical protein VMZ92_00820 [Planctomycetota bacterium]|nr:hypothetical protein [Planctomycetota bacterium]
MRIAAVVVVILALVCAFVVVDVVSAFQHATECDAALGDALMVGKVYRVLTDGGTWAGALGRLPGVLIGGPFNWRVLTTDGLIDWWALAATVVFVLACVWVIRVHLGKPWLVVGLACLVLSPVLHAAGRIALASNTSPARAGAWLATMLLGTLYPLMACAAFALVEAVTSRSLPSRMVFLEPSGARLPASYDPLYWQRLARR